MMKSAFMTAAYRFAILLLSSIVLVINILDEKKNSAVCHVQKPCFEQA